MLCYIITSNASCRGLMTQRRLISLLLLLGLILGQTFSLAHGIEHAVSVQDHPICVTCLSSAQKYGFPPSTFFPDSDCRHTLSDPIPATDSTFPCRCGYSSRAPPLTLS